MYAVYADMYLCVYMYMHYLCILYIVFIVIISL